MGDDLTLPERSSIRTPRQWSDEPNAGFSTAPAERLVRPLVHDQGYGPERVNVRAQRNDPASLLAWFETLLRTLRECPEVGENSCEVLESGHPAVLAHRYRGDHGDIIFLHNLDQDPVEVDLGDRVRDAPTPVELFSDGDYGALPDPLARLRLEGWGYRWIRLRFTP